MWSIISLILGINIILLIIIYSIINRQMEKRMEKIQLCLNSLEKIKEKQKKIIEDYKKICGELNGEVEGQDKD